MLCSQSKRGSEKAFRLAPSLSRSKIPRRALRPERPDLCFDPTADLAKGAQARGKQLGNVEVTLAASDSNDSISAFHFTRQGNGEQRQKRIRDVI